MLNKIYLVHLQNRPIFEQLQLEEALLRLDRRNFFILNEGTSPAIVMGISGKMEELIHVNEAAKRNIPIIKRFSGGGTVVVDEQTIFTTFICEKTFLPVPAYPEPILAWTAQFYQKALPFLKLKENDYVIGNHKCGGNAQYIQKDRWLQHTSFLWDFSSEQMDLLKHPKKTPKYRKERGHGEFLTPLKDHLSDKKGWITFLQQSLACRYDVETVPVGPLLELCKLPHRRTTELVYSSLIDPPSHRPVELVL